MGPLMNAMKAQALLALSGRAVTRMGIVSSYDPSAYAAKVKVQPDGYETGWLPVGALCVGNSWGIFCPPSIGDMVEVQHLENDVESGLVCMRFFNDEDRPLAVPSGEMWMVHAQGSFIKLMNDGTIQSAGNWVHDGIMRVKGDIQGDHSIRATEHLTAGGNVVAVGEIADQGGSKLMSVMRAAYNSHHHGGSPTPDVPM